MGFVSPATVAVPKTGALRVETAVLVVHANVVPLMVNDYLTAGRSTNAVPIKNVTEAKTVHAATEFAAPRASPVRLKRNASGWKALSGLSKLQTLALLPRLQK